MDLDRMKRAGQITQQATMTDEELNLAIVGTSLALAYLEGKGTSWGLAISPLRLELEQLKIFSENRKK